MHLMYALPLSEKFSQCMSLNSKTALETAGRLAYPSFPLHLLNADVKNIYENPLVSG